jgi:hypothetical protein
MRLLSRAASCGQRGRSLSPGHGSPALAAAQLLPSTTGCAARGRRTTLRATGGCAVYTAAVVWRVPGRWGRARSAGGNCWRRWLQRQPARPLRAHPAGRARGCQPRLCGRLRHVRARRRLAGTFWRTRAAQLICCGAAGPAHRGPPSIHRRQARPCGSRILRQCSSSGAGCRTRAWPGRVAAATPRHAGAGFAPRRLALPTAQGRLQRRGTSDDVASGCAGLRGCRPHRPEIAALSCAAAAADGDRPGSPAARAAPRLTAASPSFPTPPPLPQPPNTPSAG